MGERVQGQCIVHVILHMCVLLHHHVTVLQSLGLHALGLHTLHGLRLHALRQHSSSHALGN